MSGLSESKQTHVHLRNVDPATLQIIITYAYTGNLAINDSTVEPLYETACFLQVSAVTQLEYTIIVDSCNLKTVLIVISPLSFVLPRWRTSCCSAETTW